MDPPASQQILGEAAADLRTRLDGVPGEYCVHAWVTNNYNYRSGKAAVTLLKQTLREETWATEQLIVAVPRKIKSLARTNVRWTSESGDRVRMVTLDNGGDVIGCPMRAAPADWGDEVTIAIDGDVKRVEAFRILSDAEPNAVTFWVMPTPKRIGLVGVGSSEATRLTTVERIRRLIAHAGKQVKSAQNHRRYPGVVEIYNDHLPADTNDILVACLGDLNASVGPKSETTSAYYGRNGVFRETRNTSVSAVTYHFRRTASISVINRYAKYPVKSGWLTGRVVNADSAFRQTSQEDANKAE